jgi:plasmid stabilization system protein ParE
MSQINLLTELLGGHAFRPTSERQLQDQIADILARSGLTVDREVRASARDRYDLLVTLPSIGRVVLELKLAASAPAVERQAQRYAAAPDIDAVVVVTTSQRLAHELRRAGANQLGGKLFGVIALRSF